MRPSDNDVYPLSIWFSKDSKRLMKITRFIIFFSLFYFLIPFDLYVTSSDYRLYYYGTSVKEQRVYFSEDVEKENSTFTFDLKNC